MVCSYVPLEDPTGRVGPLGTERERGREEGLEGSGRRDGVFPASRASELASL